MPAAVQFHPQTRQLIVTLDGPVFEAPHAAELQGDLVRYFEQPIHELALDFGRVEEIDSAAVEMLAGLQVRLTSAAERSRLALQNAGPSVRRVLDLLGWERLFCIADAASVGNAGTASKAS